MSTTKRNRRGKGEKASSVLLSGRSVGITRPKLTKLLLNVTVQRSLGPVMVIMSSESSVADLIVAALNVYAKEDRRPILSSAQPSGFDLHYSPFSLQSLDREEKLITLGSRNFFLCPKTSANISGDDGGSNSGMSSSSSYSKRVDKTTRTGLPCLKFIFKNCCGLNM